MKYRILIIWGLLFSVSISNQSCQHKKPKNTYLGEIPAIAEFYQKKIKDLEQKTDNCSSLEKAYEYAVRAKNFRKEAAIKIGTAFAKLPGPVTVPVIQDTVQRTFTLKAVNVTSASLEELRIEAPVYFQDSILLPNTIHLEMVNQDGEP
jgi:hypothetical protein